MRSKAEQYLSKQLKKYQENKLGKAEKQLIENWFGEKEQGKHEQKELFGTVSKAALGEELFAGITNRIKKDEQQQRWYSGTWLKIAAAILIMGTVSLVWFKWNTANNENQMAYNIFETHNGEVKKIMLSDGSTIWLNAATYLKVPVNFTRSKIREIRLEHGEAFFQVKRDTLRPFQVHTGKYLTTVLGTSFNIRAYTGEQGYQVAVHSGKVKVEKLEKGSSQLLSAGLIKGQILHFDEAKNSAAIKNGNAETYMAWTTGRYLYLEDMDMMQIGTALERYYGLPVTVKTTGSNPSKYTLTITDHDIKEAVQTLAVKTGINYQLTDHSLIIKTDR